MTTKILVPALGESVVEATVSRWLKKEGDPVEAGETLVELETDKVNLEVGAEKSGILVKIKRQSGEDVKIGDVLGIMEESTLAVPLRESPPQETTAQTIRPVATPSARKLAQEKGIDLAEVPAAGYRLTVGDVENYIAAKQSQQTVVAPLPAAPLAPSAPEETRHQERIRMSRRRKTIAQRLIEAQRTAAMLTTYNEVDMTAVMDLRKKQKESFKHRYGVNLGIVSFFVKASVAALKAFPYINAEIQDDEIVLKYYYDIGIAVGAKEGLVVPVLRNADRMSIPEIEKAIKDFVDRSEAGTLTIEDLRGGTFTITNGGIFGSLMSTPILNPPQVAILGLHKIEERPVVLNGQIVIRPMMYLALSYDHRIVDGRESVQFLVKIKQLIEDPSTLLLEQ